MPESIYVSGFKHGNPIPAASRAGRLLMTGVITGRDARTGRLPEGLAAQCAAMFAHVREIVEAGGGTPDDIVKMTVWLKDPSDREALNAEWTRMYPDPDRRPARHALPHPGGNDALILCDFTALLP